MGGIGSGDYLRWSGRPTTDDMRAIDVRRWAREGLLTPGSSFGWSWSRHGRNVASINVQAREGAVMLEYRTREDGGEWEPMRYSVQLTATPCHLGGARSWFRCPAVGCGRRVAILYGGKVFACRDCHGLAYPSQNENVSDRAARRAERIRDRLGWEPGILNGQGAKPRRMHWRTFERLVVEHEKWTDLSCAMIMDRIAVMRAGIGQSGF